MIASCASRHTDDKSADATETIDNLYSRPGGRRKDWCIV
jgi:hypothetical protein